MQAINKSRDVRIVCICDTVGSVKAPSSEGEERCTEKEEREPASLGSVQESSSRGRAMWLVWLWGGGERMGKKAGQREGSAQER